MAKENYSSVEHVRTRAHCTNLIAQFTNEISGCGLWVSVLDDMAQRLACQRMCGTVPSRSEKEIKEANNSVKKLQEKIVAARSANTPR